MKKEILIFGLLINSFIATAQLEQNIWALDSHSGLDFNTMLPVPTSSSLLNNDVGIASICNAHGQILFYSNGLWVWNRNNELMPAQTSGIGGYTAPLSMSIGYPPLMPLTGGSATQAAAVCRAPGHPSQYYLFSLCTSGQLFYSLIDTTLDSGHGDIISGKKGIFISGNNTEKMTVVNGCENVWLIIRSTTVNEYKAYEINDTGIVTNAVISNCGSFPVSWYQHGVIKFSPDGSKMTAACYNDNYYAGYSSGGLELYDFEAKTGRLSNARVLDSSSTAEYYYGACFSSDNTKLYATTSSFTNGGTFYPEHVWQYNVGLGTLPAIIGSKTLLYTDTTPLDGDVSDLKRAIDGKMYMGSGGPYSTGPVYMHCINSPNTAGIGCGFTPNAVPMSITLNGGLPNDIALIDAPDTITNVKNLAVCFGDSVSISADTGKWYHWQDGLESQSRVVKTNGFYSVGYINNGCSYELDTFKVNFIHVPVISPNSYSCEGQKRGIAWIRPATGDTATFTFSWKDVNGVSLQQHTTHNADTLRGLDTGLYRVEVHTIGGCDTSLWVRILGIPSPQASVNADSLVCKGLPVNLTANTDGATGQWYFGDGDSSATLSTTHYYQQAGNYTATFVTSNIEGCSDTISRNIQIRIFKLNLSSDKDNVNTGEQITLQTTSAEPYIVTEWEPSKLFNDQSAFSQPLKIDTTLTFIVFGHSDAGCTDTAMIVISVNPQVFIPSAFTPNGDGLNDRFRPRTAGSGIFIDDFEIYNRWGQMVWYGFGANAAEGWDGKFHGIDAEIGTYFYTIHMVTLSGGTISQKGDVTLIR
jgi:gliding motility-associated-like protein